MIKRILAKTLESSLFKGKAIILYGARQVGKTTLINDLFQNKKSVLKISGDDLDIQQLFENATSERLKFYIGNHCCPG
jgi:uncharacterized protein